MGGLLGISGFKFRYRINTSTYASSAVVMDNVTSGVIFFVTNAPDYWCNYTIYVYDSNKCRAMPHHIGDASSYNSMTISNGTITLTNTGYGVGTFKAYYLQYD